MAQPHCCIKFGNRICLNYVGKQCMLVLILTLSISHGLTNGVTVQFHDAVDVIWINKNRYSCYQTYYTLRNMKTEDEQCKHSHVLYLQTH